jgi:hypothetical protein
MQPADAGLKNADSAKLKNASVNECNPSLEPFGIGPALSRCSYSSGMEELDDQDHDYACVNNRGGDRPNRLADHCGRIVG